MNFGEMMFGSSGRNRQVPTMSNQQSSAVHNMLGMGLAGMQDPYAGFAPIAQQARQQYQQSIPSLASRFTSLSPSLMRTGGFKNSMDQNNQNFEQMLAALQAQYGLQNRGQFMNMASMGLQPTFENQYTPGNQGLFQSIAGPAFAGMATGGLSGMGMFGRGMMDAYRGSTMYGRGY